MKLGFWHAAELQLTEVIAGKQTFAKFSGREAASQVDYYLGSLFGHCGQTQSLNHMTTTN